MDAKEFKKLLKQIKFPGGQDARVTPERLEARWYKRHGHAGANTIRNVAIAAKAAGFQPTDHTYSSDATGDRVGSGSHYAKATREGTWQLYVRSYYGVTAYENSFTVEVAFKPAPAVKDPA